MLQYAFGSFEPLFKAFEQFLSSRLYAILGATIFLVAAVLFAYWAGRALRYVLADQFELDTFLVNLTVRVLRISLVILSTIVVLDEYGLNVTSLIATLSVFGLAMAFGMRPIMVNFFTGAMVSAMKPYEVGDYIEAANVKGVVESTNYFHTVVVTTDGTYASVPNGPMWAKSIKNRSRLRPSQLVFDVTVKLGLEYEALRTAIDGIMRNDPQRYPAFAPSISIDDVTDETLTLAVAGWYEPAALLQAREALPLVLRDKLISLGALDVTVKPRSKPEPKKQTKPSASEESSDDLI